MSDTRFIIIGIGFIFSGFLIFGVLGTDYRTTNIEMTEFGDCFDYSQKNPIPVNCSYKMFDQGVFFAVVIALVVGGMIFLIKGVKGRWDNEVKPEDMVGPSRDKNPEKEDHE